jgi:hypothetical protein
MNQWHNDLAQIISLDGEWDFALAGQTGSLQVPGSWEAQGFDRRTDGPASFSRMFSVPQEWHGKNIQLQFDAVSYYIEAYVNGIQVGTHTGSWSPFAFDVTQALRAGSENEIHLTVYKTGERFAVRESLAGFLPDVALMFGGLWQSVRLVTFDGPAFSNILLECDSRTGEVTVSANVHQADGTTVVVKIIAPDGSEVTRWQGIVESENIAARLHVSNPQQWRPDQPALYTAEICLEKDGSVVAHVLRQFGFRELSYVGEQLLLNGVPVFLRSVLNWGWYPDILCPAPDEATIRDEFRRVRALGFNMVKLCLYEPSPLYFDIADEEGMLLWLELPMWLPQVTPRLKAQAPIEYSEIMAAVHHHPSVVIYSLGCELNQTVSADFVAQLNQIVRSQGRGALVCDNSGSGEAYGGAFDFADFNDYHFYCDLHYFDPLVDHFRRDWRPARPWIFGEFCDADDYRDLSEIETSFGGQLPWWLTEQNPLHPLSFVAYSEQNARMEKLNLDSQRVMDISRRQSFVVRKTILEKVRARSGMGGYVVTGIRDTPLATSAMFDDLGRSKYEADAFRTFNDETVLVIGRGRARAWTRGGDRPSPFEPYSFVAGEQATLDIIVSHAGATLLGGNLTWKISNQQGEIFAKGSHEVGEVLSGSKPRLIGRAAFETPQTDEARALRLDVALHSGERTIRNNWPLWVFPSVTTWPEGLALLDPTGSLTGLDDLWEAAEKVTTTPNARHIALITSTLNEGVIRYLHEGGAVMLIQHGDRPLPARSCPFWREAIKLIGDLPGIPHEGFVDLQFYGLATDWTFDSDRLAELLSDISNMHFPLRRLDARQFTLLDYVIEAQVGAGRLIASTLRFQGGLGDQPFGLRSHYAGRWLLSQLFEQLINR